LDTQFKPTPETLTGLLNQRQDVNEEIELKLLATAGELELIRGAPVFARYALDKGSAQRLEAIYYDTPDRTLMRNSLSLRVRRNGRRFVQTLKRAPIYGQPFVRGEWETAVASSLPDLSVLPVAEIGAPLDDLTVNALGPVFVTKVRRRVQRLGLSGAIIEVACDEGSIEAGEYSEPITEVELELKAGDSSVVYDLGMQLLEIAPLKIGTLSKSDRGYDLAFKTATATKAKPPDISAEQTIDDVVCHLLAPCQHHLLVNQIIAERGWDPEGVHQMRVALRRLRTACTLLSSEIGSPTLRVFATEAKWLGQVLGAPRDWDVLMTDTVAGPQQILGTDFDFEGLRNAAEPHRVAAYATLREALASARYNRFHLSLSRWIACRGWRNELENKSLAVLLEPSAMLANRVLTRLHRAALKRGKGFRHLQPEARHKLRIALKKLRYTTEFFQGVYGADADAANYLKCLARLQTALGHANDATITQPLLSVLGGDPVTPQTQRAIGAVIGWQARDRAAIETTLYEHWRRFRVIPTFWPGDNRLP
jgi:triphosphatase